MPNATAPNAPKQTEKAKLTLDMSVQDALSMVASGAVPMEAYLEWDAMRIAAIKANSKSLGQIRFKVARKGGVSVYGLSAQYPVTLYADQWKRLLAQREQIEAFIEEHKADLSAGKYDPRYTDEAIAAREAADKAGE